LRFTEAEESWLKLSKLDKVGLRLMEEDQGFDDDHYYG
jgi:hypothetical protein